MKEIILNTNSHVKTIPFNISQSGEDIIIGSTAQQDSLIKIDKSGLEVIELMNLTYTITEIENIMSKKYHQNISIRELVRVLFDAHLISSVDDKPVSFLKKKRQSFNSNMLNFISSIIFSKTSYLIYVFLLIMASLFYVHKLEYSYRILLDYFLQNPFFVLIIAWGLVIKHELFHYIAALSLGIQAEIRFGTRFIFIVMETHADAIYLQEKRRRYRFYLAGILGDLVFLALLINLTTILSYIKIYINPRFIDICLLQTILGIVFQFDIFLKTDLYFVIADLLNKDNLYHVSGTFIKNLFKKDSFIKHFRDDKLVVAFALGRLLNYFIISIPLLLSLYFFTKHNKFSIDISYTQNMLTILLYALLYFFIVFFIKIKKQERFFKYKIVFQTGSPTKL